MLKSLLLPLKVLNNKIRTNYYSNASTNKMNQIENIYKMWTPCEDIFQNFRNKSYVIVVLNCRITLNIDHRHLLNLWTHAKLRVTVDGGTKRWIEWLQAHQCDNETDNFAPDLITGDLDSISEELLEYFQKIKHSKIIKTPDQNETDFTKALKEIHKHCHTNNLDIDTIFVLADTSGRFDHIIANINTLYKASSFMREINIFQIASNSITFLLTPGSHKISIPEELRKNLEWCALMPLGASCNVSSTGLKWNLDNANLAFGGMLSTSNTYNGDPFVTVITDGIITWSMGIEAVL